MRVVERYVEKRGMGDMKKSASDGLYLVDFDR